jgi:thiol-disulfide isomerase/thioredoxin
MVKIIGASSEIPRQGLVVVDFFATWCGPCKQIAPYYEQMAGTFTGVTFLKADVDQFDDETGGAFDVQVLPTFMFLRDGAVVETVKGADLNKVMKVLGDLEKGST